MSLEETIRVRVSVETKRELEAARDEREEGGKVSDVVRIAIGEYIARRKLAQARKRKNRGK